MSTLNDFTNRLESWGQHPEIEKNRRRTLEIAEKFMTDFPEDYESRVFLGIIFNNLANLCLGKVLFEEAERLYRRCISLLEKTRTATPESRRCRYGLALGFANLGDLLRRTGRFQDAEQAYDGSLRVVEGLIRDAPTNDEYRLCQASIHMRLALMLHQAGRRSEIGPAFWKGRALFERLIADRPTLTEPRLALSYYLANFPDTSLRKTAQALTLAEEAVGLAPRAADPLIRLGQARYRAGDWKGTIEAMGKALEIRPESESTASFFLAMAFWKLGNRDQAIIQYKRAIEHMKKTGCDNDEPYRIRHEAAALLGMPVPPRPDGEGPLKTRN